MLRADYSMGRACPEELQVAGVNCAALGYVTVSWTSIPAHGPPLPLLYILHLPRHAHPSCTNWVWYWNPPLTAYAHVQPLAVKTSMFSATIMIIAAEHSAKGISKSD